MARKKKPEPDTTVSMTAVVGEDGSLRLENLPFEAGELVEVVLRRPSAPPGSASSARAGEMRVYGVDFTSAPSKSKPLTCAHAAFDGSTLRIESVEEWKTFEEFEEFLESEGPWIAGLDFPFGQARGFVEGAELPLAWSGYVDRLGELDRPAFRALIAGMQADRPKGSKRHFRRVDALAHAQSPMNVVRPPVGLMFHEGARRLLASRASILPCRPMDTDRHVVEAYPRAAACAMLGLSLATAPAYKEGDGGSKQALARRKIVAALQGECCESVYGFRLGIDAAMAARLGKDRDGDVLDAVLCAVQAAWSWARRADAAAPYGIPAGADPNEGWIVDPALLRTAAT